jgi:hypothetical protein
MAATSQPSPDPARVYGLLAEFATAEELTAAVEAVRNEGYARIDAYSPMPVEGLGEALGLRHTRLPLLVLIGGLVGGVTGYLMQWWMMTVSYPLNIGGRPLHSWPAFIPITFELTILGAALTAVLGMLALNGLPQPYHPLFNVPEFSLASQNRFFLCIEAADKLFDATRSRELLERLGALKVSLVEY